MARRGRVAIPTTKAESSEGSGVLDILQADRRAAGRPTSALVSELIGNPDNPRTDLGDIEEMAESLRVRGQLQPVTVVNRETFLAVKPQHAEGVPETARYVVLYGNRRLAAAPRAGLDRLLIHVAPSPTDAGEILAGALVENIHRENLSPLDEAKALAELSTFYGSQNKAAKQLGKTSGWVSQRMALLNLVPELTERLVSGELKIKEARSLGRLDAKEQVAAWRQGAYPVSGKASTPRGAYPVSTPAPASEAPPATEPPSAPSSNSSKGRQEPEPARGSSASSSEQGRAAVVLDLSWEPKRMIDRLYEELGSDRFARLITEGLDRLP